MKYNYQLQRLWQCAEQITLSSLLQLTQTSLPRSLGIAQYLDSSFPNSNWLLQHVNEVYQLFSWSNLIRSTIWDSPLISFANFSVELFVFSTNFDSSVDEFDAIHIIIINWHCTAFTSFSLYSFWSWHWCFNCESGCNVEFCKELSIINAFNCSSNGSWIIRKHENIITQNRIYTDLLPTGPGSASQTRNWVTNPRDPLKTRIKNAYS